LQRQALLEVEELGVDVAGGEHFFGQQGGHHRVILEVKTGEDVGD
jgi:hypothetical protein